MHLQQQPPEMFCENSCFCSIHRKIPVLESLCNKDAGLKACTFIKRRIWRRCFPVNIAKFWTVPILKNLGERLLLHLWSLIDEAASPEFNLVTSSKFHAKCKRSSLFTVTPHKNIKTSIRNQGVLKWFLEIPKHPPEVLCKKRYS